MCQVKKMYRGHFCFNKNVHTFILYILLIFLNKINNVPKFQKNLSIRFLNIYLWVLSIQRLCIFNSN
jgi:hypothetical protein